jgi:hypothetical protein
VIEVQALTKRFGATVALDEVTLSGEAGRVLALPTIRRGTRSVSPFTAPSLSQARAEAWSR